MNEPNAVKLTLLGSTNNSSNLSNAVPLPKKKKRQSQLIETEKTHIHQTRHTRKINRRSQLEIDEFPPHQFPPIPK